MVSEDEGGKITVKAFSESSSALVLAPPKPQLLSVGPDGQNHPLITWAANVEPDVNNYKVYKYAIPEYGWQYLGTSAHHAHFQDFYETYCVEYPPCYSSHDVWYRVTAIDNQAKESVPSDSAIAYVSGWDPQKRIPQNIITDIPEEYSLSSNYPNPFNPTTTIRYQISKDNFVNLRVFNTLGQMVDELVNDYRRAGTYEVTFDASKLSSGIYFYKIISGDFTDIKKMLLLR